MKQPRRCAFCDHRPSAHGPLGCDMHIPYQDGTGVIVGSHKCPCSMTKTGIRTNIDITSINQGEK